MAVVAAATATMSQTHQAIVFSGGVDVGDSIGVDWDAGATVGSGAVYFTTPSSRLIQPVPGIAGVSPPG